MGLYVNPKGQSKEAWLAEHGEITDAPASVKERPGHLPVCLVDNGAFTAAGVAVDEQELSMFKGNGRDPRPKRWYWVATSLLPNVMLPHEREQFLAEIGGGA